MNESELKASILHDLLSIVKSSCHAFDQDRIIARSLIQNLEQEIAFYASRSNQDPDTESMSK